MPRKKILLVDDSATTLLMEKMILAKGAYDLATAASGEEAIETARRERPDLILLDVVMPGLSGFDVCKVLREEEATRETPIIMVTTRGEAHNVETGFKLGCDDYVTKPIDSLELKSKVESYLEGGCDLVAENR